ncbi:MAG: hypothetical protein AB1791_06750 [Chloroflexota bacterium]
MGIFVSGTIAPWLLGGLLCLVLLTLTITVKSWYAAKRSPYFFLRLQAARRLQQYGLTSLGLICLTAATAAYAWPKPVDTTPRVAILTHAKPLDVALEEGADGQTAVTPADHPQVIELKLNGATNEAAASPVTGPAEALPALPSPQLPALPTEYDKLEPTAGLNDNTTITPLQFSTQISNQYEAVNPRRIFGEGFFTLYATFVYEAMADGMEWAWVWRRDGTLVSGGNELWAYGKEGPGYIFLNPEEGFQPGDYSLAVWVNGQLQQQASLIVTGSTASR